MLYGYVNKLFSLDQDLNVLSSARNGKRICNEDSHLLKETIDCC